MQSGAVFIRQPVYKDSPCSHISLKKGAIMTVNQASINADIRYATLPSQNYSSTHTWWQRLRLAIHDVFSNTTVTDDSSPDCGFIHFETARKERKAFNPYDSSIKFELVRLI